MVLLRLPLGRRTAGVTTGKAVGAAEPDGLRARALALLGSAEVHPRIRERLATTTLFAHCNSFRIVEAQYFYRIRHQAIA